MIYTSPCAGAPGSDFSREINGLLESRLLRVRGKLILAPPAALTCGALLHFI
jgi:hypothetical protein